MTTQLRVGWMEARRQDEYLGKRYGLVGQETTGVGGMAKALRTIPVLLAIARDMAELAPGALLVNFTNPAGLVTEALARYAPDVPAVGVCNVPITAKMLFLERWQAMTGVDRGARAGAAPDAGPQPPLLAPRLHHRRRGRVAAAPRALSWPSCARRARPRLGAAPRRVLQMVPNYYLHYFYDTSKKIAEQEQWPPSRAEEVMAVEQDLLRQYADPS